MSNYLGSTHTLPQAPFTYSIFSELHTSTLYIFTYIYMWVRIFFTNMSLTVGFFSYHIKPSQESQCTICLKHTSPWDAAQSGNHRNQNSCMQTSMGRWVSTIIYFILSFFVFMAGKYAITFWTLHQSTYCVMLSCTICWQNTMGRKFPFMMVKVKRTARVLWILPHAAS